MHLTLDKCKNEWKKKQVALWCQMDGWIIREGSITNFVINSPKGTIFLKSINAFDISKNAKNLFQLLDSLVQEIGEKNVVQVVTDSASTYVLAGEKLIEKRRKIFWNPCAAHCIDLMLHDIGDLFVHANTIKKKQRRSLFLFTVIFGCLIWWENIQKREGIGKTRCHKICHCLLNFKEYISTKN